MPSVVGHLDNPERYTARRAATRSSAARSSSRCSIAVYTKPASGGHYFLLRGKEKPLRGTHRWTMTDGTAMRGTTPIGATAPGVLPSDDGDGLDDADLAAAIANSLADLSPPEEPPEPKSMLNRPCKHLIYCQTCAPKMLRLPCGVCRRNVARCERVFL
ncbi:hypothetical protein EMIHUDRAFT_207595 [Emiliania huxleyi CCMP1516]|uniref:RING-type domain-containing protein n=2 Tax=Emiliania huxleyi TaxID=2903 RepID=A0A0D3JDQ0_EMIH1|nr:hypothetical protein EMIHUDRAFT_207595 [Emiliania huxleyi CCMP1516]EOD21635.1 hypothetical protein EMIHUDRAFT_207595 [Emiliania huxleyi CCMP1516]|eukprot:XP_005774064.1 hypothetical protein EMIHUDRAFT_207595 [Emiliania huxleyi CCMP1516]